MAQHFKVDVDPPNYPVHMNGKTVLTPVQKKKNLQSDAAGLIKAQGHINHTMEIQPYVDLNKLSAAARSFRGVLMKKHAVLLFCKPSTDSATAVGGTRKTGKTAKNCAVATSKECKLPAGATYMSPPISVLPSGPAKKRAKTTNVEIGDTLGNQ